VELCGGGFGANPEWVRRHAPLWSGLTPLGTPGDDGGVIELGRRAGAALGCMSKIAGWRFISLPSAFTDGVLVDRDGERVGNEQLYGATISEVLVERHGTRAHLVLDRDIWAAARARARTEAAFFHVPQMA
jgi:3-oxo-5alpha-steroid 4-dehydrogenase